MSEIEKFKSMMDDMNRRKDNLHTQMLQLKSLNSEIKNLNVRAKHDPIARDKLKNVHRIMAEEGGEQISNRLSSAFGRFDATYRALENKCQQASQSGDKGGKSSIHSKAKKKFNRVFA